MGLMIYNSLTNKIEEFKTHESGIVNMYVCGPTVYDYIHIGNARPVIFYDMLKNYLEYIGYKVNYASNITDVDDKIINKALEQGVSEEEIAKKYEDAYFKNCNDLGSKRPTFVPHATAYIKEMLDFIGQLVNKGYAYEVNGDVYFRVNHLDSYGVLSNQVQEELQMVFVRMWILKKKIRLILFYGKKPMLELNGHQYMALVVLDGTLNAYV